MKKQIIFSLVWICVLIYGFTGNSSATQYKVKYYSPFINQTKCNQTLQSIPQEYFLGISWIKVFDLAPYTRTGQYWYFSSVIDLIAGCDKEVLIHELAHHCQYKRGDSFREAKQHRGHFDECENEIWRNSNGG